MAVSIVQEWGKWCFVHHSYLLLDQVVLLDLIVDFPSYIPSHPFR